MKKFNNINFQLNQTFSNLVDKKLGSLGFKHWKTLDKPNELSGSKHLAIYTTAENKKLVIRSISNSQNKKEIAQFQNEIKMLKLLTTLVKRQKLNLNFPHIINVIQHSESLIFSMLRQYVDGKTLASFISTRKLTLLLKTLATLPQLSTSLTNDEIKSLKHKSPFFMFFEMPIYWLVSTLKNHNLIKSLANVYWNYLKYFNFQDIINPQLILAYRDIHSHNIIINHNRISLIDAEICVMGEVETDYALAFLLYADEISMTKLNQALQNQLLNIASRKRFIKLVSFYTLQLLAIQNKKSDYYSTAIKVVKHLSLMPLLSKI